MMLGIFLDIETTGLDASRHHAIDVALKILDLASGQEKVSYQRVVKLAEENWNLRDPVSMEINGYTWEMIEKGQALSEIRDEIITLFLQQQVIRGKAVYICQNPSFDRGFFSQIIDVYAQERLHWPYHWLDFASMYWALVVKKAKSEHSALPDSMNLSKNAIASAYGLPEETSPHRAMNGVNHLIQCYEKVVGFLH